MLTVVTAKPTWSYREAEEILKVHRRALAAIAQAEGFERQKGKSLDAEGLRRLARYFKRDLQIPISA